MTRYTVSLDPLFVWSGRWGSLHMRGPVEIRRSDVHHGSRTSAARTSASPTVSNDGAARRCDLQAGSAAFRVLRRSGRTTCSGFPSHPDRGFIGERGNGCTNQSVRSPRLVWNGERRFLASQGPSARAVETSRISKVTASRNSSLAAIRLRREPPTGAIVRRPESTGSHISLVTAARFSHDAPVGFPDSREKLRLCPAPRPPATALGAWVFL